MNDIEETAIREDQTIVGFLDEIGPEAVAEMLCASKNAVLCRAEALRYSGAWDHYVEADAAMRRAMMAAGHLQHDQSQANERPMRTMHVIVGGRA